METLENKIYFYLSQRLLDFFIGGEINNGTKYQIKFENKGNVAALYNYLKLTVGLYDDENIRLGEYSYHDYSTYYIEIKGIKLIVATFSDGDFLTGLRNNFQKVPGFESDSALLFVHYSDLDSINKGGIDLTAMGMPLNYATISLNIIDEFKKQTEFNQTQKYFLTELLNLEFSDFEIENSNVFDLSKYLSILLQKNLKRENYIELGVFYDKEIQDSNLSNLDVKLRVRRNAKIFKELSKQDDLGTLKGYLERNFDAKGQNALAKRETWDKTNYDAIESSIEGRQNTAYNEYLVHDKHLSTETLKIWDRDEAKAGSKSKSKTFSLIVFNRDKAENLQLNLKFKRTPKAEFFSEGFTVSTDSATRTASVEISLFDPERFYAFELAYEEEIDKKTNKIKFNILVVPFQESILSPISASYKVSIAKDKSFRLIAPYEGELKLNPLAEEEETIELEQGGSYKLTSGESLGLRIQNTEAIESGRLDFNLRFGHALLPFSFLIGEIKRPVIVGKELWRKKNELGESFFYTIKNEDTIVLEQANISYIPTGEIRGSLFLEKQLIDCGFPVCMEEMSGVLSESEEHLPEDLTNAYQLIIDYYRNQALLGKPVLPSTAYIGMELKAIYQTYVDLYLAHLNRVRDNEALDPVYRSLLKLGTVSELDKLKSLKITPLHPLMVCYQLEASKILDQPFLAADNREMLKMVSANGLLPFIKNGSGDRDFFIATDQEHSPEWLFFVNASVQGQTVNRKNVAEVISTKIQEFIGHFSFYFIDSDSPIRINLINVGDGREAMKGLLQYFSTLTKSLLSAAKNPNLVYPLAVNIYGADGFFTCFEQFSRFDDAGIIKEKFGIDLKSLKGTMEIEDFLKLFHQKAQFFIKSRKGIEGVELDYAHLSFHQFNENEISRADNNSGEVPTGLSLNGLSAEVPSVYLHGDYKTSFGTKYLPDNAGNVLVELVKKLNYLAQIHQTSNIYKSGHVFASLINNNVKQSLNKIYEASQWVTFINPGVDLNFFKKGSEVAIIHYADQFSNSSSYDSITITTKYEHYETILNQYLKDKVEHIDGSERSIINIYNALNGYWLLKLGSQSQTDNVNKEKISILSAVKEAFAILDHPDVTWVALSLEEILRVTGASKLKTKVGIFALANLNQKGQHSDDLLMVGMQEIDGALHLYFYPIEVKTGIASTGVIEKAGKQGKNTFNLLIETLSQPGLKGKMYRNSFAKLTINAAQKLSLYDIWPGYRSKWEEIEKWRGKMLNDDFVIGSLRDYIGVYGVISFRKNSTASRSIQLDGAQLNISLYEADGLNDLLLSIDKLKERYQDRSAFADNEDGTLAIRYEKPVFYNLVEDYQESHREEPQQVVISAEDEDGQDLGSLAEILVNEENLEENPALMALELSHESIDEIPDSEPVTVKKPLSVVFGNRTLDGDLVEWFPTSANKVSHTNTGIIGTMGTGKTQFTKSLITQLIRNSDDNVGGKKIGILIFDYKGDYVKEDFVQATGAKVYDLHQLPFNPFSLSVGKHPKKLLPLHTASTFQDTIKKAFGLGNKQDLALSEAIMEAYTNAGILKGDPNTWDKPAPTMKDMVEIYMDRDKVAKDSLFAALKKLYDFEFFEPNPRKTKPLFDLIDGVTIINLEKNSAEIQNLIVAITLDQFYAQMQIAGSSEIDGSLRQINKMILVDEADNFMSKNFESLRKILKEGREYGVGTILSTQFLNHFTTAENEYSSYILTWIMHKVSEIKDKEIATIFKLPNKKDRDELAGEIKELEIHHSMVYFGSGEPVKIKDRAFWELVKDEEE
ncbi:DUF87 domain-containing protein [Pedobacter aquatilis]|uniref:helicase HerA domain-containing protein n=1 Tax=Pedobacter aquatilis TaxID=351343 RepID=UPI0025B5A92B|nr:DUF87 domain-containing protein [Pedobacter aquatilis]MDN3586103.1 DUF87 domain-containing protein [Pedobacter aquatilis]